MHVTGHPLRQNHVTFCDQAELALWQCFCPRGDGSCLINTLEGGIHCWGIWGKNDLWQHAEMYEGNPEASNWDWNGSSRLQVETQPTIQHVVSVLSNLCNMSKSKFFPSLSSIIVKTFIVLFKKVWGAKFLLMGKKLRNTAWPTFFICTSKDYVWSWRWTPTIRFLRT